MGTRTVSVLPELLPLLLVTPDEEAELAVGVVVVTLGMLVSDSWVVGSWVVDSWVVDS